MSAGVHENHPRRSCFICAKIATLACRPERFRRSPHLRKRSSCIIVGCSGRSRPEDQSPFADHVAAARRITATAPLSYLPELTVTVIHLTRAVKVCQPRGDQSSRHGFRLTTVFTKCNRISGHLHLRPAKSSAVQLECFTGKPRKQAWKYLRFLVVNGHYGTSSAAIKHFRGPFGICGVSSRFDFNPLLTNHIITPSWPIVPHPPTPRTFHIEKFQSYLC